MSLITVDIPKQGFEIVKETIGAILTTELTAQKKKKQFTHPINVYVGRSTPFHQSEKVMVNVLVDSASYSNSHQAGTHGNTIFFIDTYVSMKQTENENGGTVSSQIRDLFLGMNRFILQDHHYKTLGLPVNGCIMGTEVTGFENFETNNSQDSSFVKMSRLTFSVRINETQSLWDGIDINSIFTTVKLDLTDKGYFYETVEE